MSGRMQSPRTEILTRLLQTYERSVSYGRPGPWSRDVILKFDQPTFPEAFAPDGRELRAALVFAAHELEASGCIRIVRHTRGPLAGEPKEIRLGPDHLDRTYDAAARLIGYEPLAVGLAELERHAIKLVDETMTLWMRAFLEKLVLGARTADLTVVGMSRERFKREWRDFLSSLTASRFLADGIMPAWERVVSEKIFRDSKQLGRIRSQIVSILVNADPRWDGVPPEEASDLLEAYGVRRKPGLIRCAGAATLHVGSGAYKLEDFSPVAHLPDTWAEAWVDAVIASNVRIVTTIENEYPFLSYVEEAGGPTSLGARGELVVYTAGFPTPSLMGALIRIADLSSDTIFRHWGDADVGGLRIWWFLRTGLAHRIELLRTTADWVASESERGGRSLSGPERAALARMLVEFESLEESDVASAREVIRSLLQHGIKIEQERF